MTSSDTDAPLVLTGYTDVWEGLRQRDFKQALYEAGGAVLDDALITLHGDEHKQRRRAENKLFRRGTFRWWELNLVPGTIERSYREPLEQGSADLVHLGRRTIMHLTAMVAGIDPPRDEISVDRLEHCTEIFSKGATAVHTTRELSELNREIAEATAAFDEHFFSPSLERRRRLIKEYEAGRIEETGLPRDVLTAVLRQQESLGLGRAEMQREVAFYLQAGSHSTANLFTHAAHQIFTRMDDPEFRAKLDDRRFLQRCVLETLRLNPASPVAWRRALSEVTLTSGITVPKGSLVEFDLRAANSDPEVWGDSAGSFEPDRELPDGIPQWGHSFGGGHHACIGMELDGGVQQSVGTDEHEQVFGTVTLMIDALVRNGATPDPADPPTRESDSTRGNFARYPVLFKGGAGQTAT